jgi:hypothetical protein
MQRFLLIPLLFLLLTSCEHSGGWKDSETSSIIKVVDEGSFVKTDSEGIVIAFAVKLSITPQKSHLVVPTIEEQNCGVARARGILVFITTKEGEYLVEEELECFLWSDASYRTLLGVDFNQDIDISLEYEIPRNRTRLLSVGISAAPTRTGSYQMVVLGIGPSLPFTWRSEWVIIQE